MSLAETIYQHSLRLPAAAAREALDFIEFLERRYAVEPGASAAPPAAKARRQAGSARGVLVIVEDDEAHLDDFREYLP